MNISAQLLPLQFWLKSSCIDATCVFVQGCCATCVLWPASLSLPLSPLSSLSASRPRKGPGEAIFPLFNPRSAALHRQVDKDVAVAREHFGLSASYSAMSPLVLYKGYTKRFLDGKVRKKSGPVVVRGMFVCTSKNKTHLCGPGSETWVFCRDTVVCHLRTM